MFALSSRSPRKLSTSVVWGLMLVLLPCALDAQKAKEVSDLDPPQVYRVGFERDFPPYSFADEDGKPIGLVPELLQAIAKVMNLQFEWVAGSTGDLRLALERGEIDIFPTLPSSSSNEKRFSLSLPHTSVEDGVFVRGAAASSKGASSLADCLAGKQIAVLENDPALDFLDGLESKIPRQLESTVADALRRLAAGNAECALLPRATGLLLSRELDLKNIRLLPVQIVEYDRLLTFAVARGNLDLLDELEEGTEIVTADGTYVALFSKWAQYSGHEGQLARRLAWLLLPVLAITLFSITWTWMLRREVARRTEELHDAEASKRAVEARIAEAQKLESLTLLAGGVAHDFNNLLMAMLGNTSLALYQSPPDSPITERLREVQKAGRRAADLCQQMLAYSGRGRFVIERLDLSKMVEDMSGLLQANLTKRVEIKKRLASDLPKIEADASQLRQVLMNLVVNASEAVAGTNGTVEIRTGSYEGELPLEDLGGEQMPVGSYAFLEVRDDGTGMDEATRKRIFEPFFTTKFTGRGLGLAATLGIVRGHRGAVQVESRVGQGTTFRLFFPACGEETSAEAPEEAAEAEKDEPAAASSAPEVPERVESLQ